MKRMIAILIALLLVTLPALSESFSTFDYITGQTGNAYLLYTFPDVRLYLPLDWLGRITVEADDAGASFYQTASHEKYLEEGIASGGFLFRLCADANESFRELPAYAYIGYSENVGLHFYLELPSDYPAYPEGAAQAEYDEMAAQVDAVAEDSRVERSMLFYTEGLDGTEPGMS